MTTGSRAVVRVVWVVLVALVGGGLTACAAPTPADRAVVAPTAYAAPAVATTADMPPYRYLHLGACKRALAAAASRDWMPVERRAELLPPAAGVANMFALVIDSTYVGVFPVPSNGRVDAIPLVPDDQIASLAQVRGSELREVVDFPGWSLLCVTRR